MEEKSKRNEDKFQEAILKEFQKYMPKSNIEDILSHSKSIFDMIKEIQITINKKKK